MRHQTLLIRFEPQATPPEGEPPSFNVKSGPGTITLLDGDEAGLPRGVLRDPRRDDR